MYLKTVEGKYSHICATCKHEGQTGRCKFCCRSNLWEKNGIPNTYRAEVKPIIFRKGK